MYEYNSLGPLFQYMKDQVKDGAVSIVSGKKIKMKMKKSRKEKQVSFETILVMA